MNPIEKSATNILILMIENKIERASGNILKELSGHNPEDINDAIDYLDSINAITVLRSLRTAPYNFLNISVNSRGRYLYHELKKKTDNSEEKEIHINPLGSPYGFTEYDWEYVSSQRKDKNTLYLVIGLQFKSEFYNTYNLVNNIKKHFFDSTKLYETKKDVISLKFEELSAGYGEHLFNNIARNVIGSDIAVFEISDQNPNVMIELGVALTWGIPILLLRRYDSPKPSSDISGYTWGEYKDDGESILEKNFHKKLKNMMDGAVIKKRAL